MTVQGTLLRALRKPRGTAPQGFGTTQRTDGWYWGPLSVGVWLALLVLYAVFSALLWKPIFGAGYEVDGYQSPFFHRSCPARASRRGSRPRS